MTKTPQDKIDAAHSFLTGLADRLDRWAHQSRVGGWSTHQVDDNIEAANDCRRIAAELKGVS